MSEYKIGTFNCKNFIYENNIEKFEYIKNIIKNTKISMLLLQEFAVSKDKIKIGLPSGWDIVLYHGKWRYKNNYQRKIKKEPTEPFDDTDGEYLRNPKNDNGYAILWNTKDFSIENVQNNKNLQQLLQKRNKNNNLARPPQIEYFHLCKNPRSIFAIMNTHLTFSGKYDLFKPKIRKDSIIPNYQKINLQKKARVEEMSEILKLYYLTNNQSSFDGVHYTTILGGDFNLSIEYLQEIFNSPKHPATTSEYNKEHCKDKDVTSGYNQIYALNSSKTTLHKKFKEGLDYKYHSYDHFIINQENCKTEVYDSVKGLKDFFDESKDKYPKNDEHYSKLSDHLPVIVTVDIV